MLVPECKSRGKGLWGLQMVRVWDQNRGDYMCRDVRTGQYSVNDILREELEER